MSFDPEKEITKLWRALHSAQDEIGRTYYQWREIALELAGPDANSMDITLKASEKIGKDVAKTFLPRLNWLKGEEAWLMSLAKLYAGIWANEGAIVKVEKGENPYEVLIKCTRDPWPTFAKEYGAPMEEVAVAREKMFQTILEDVNVFFNVNYKIEMVKAIPRGDGETLLRLYK